MNPISLASGVVPEFGPVATIQAAQTGGFDAVGLWIENRDWNGALLRDARAALADSGLPLLDVEVIWLKPDNAMDDHRRTLDIGIELGAANVLCVSSDPDHGATAARLAELCRHVEGSGMRVALEFGIFTEVKDLASALAILDRVGHPNRALLLDPIHIDRSGSTLAGLADIDPGLLPYAQICDAPAARPDPADFEAVIIDAIDLREQCGDGALPLRTFHAALPPGTPLSVELRSKKLRDAYPDAGARAREVAEATRRWLGSL
ncbi:xylose isomerase [Sphingomonas sp. Root710]|uniref:sugar phosphate isomerase/epimerase family protein n=1 Tax=Sphingomonas sp. Root710 TaxID=1736594 RepID=UPI0006FA07BA|nr:sugar phosphate isomerase/epimerase [Sphingomonas sp. Root710]KRB85252.1 xylose isomerase [Sphingomonas sp. Root710]